MTGAELLVRCLEREGVRYVFGVPGEETLHVNEALARPSIQFVPVRHEQAAAFTADGRGRPAGPAGGVAGGHRPRASRSSPTALAGPRPIGRRSHARPTSSIGPSIH